MAKGSLKQKKDRHDRLIGLLRSNEFTTTTQLRRDLDVSYRTLMRDIQELRDSGYPIDADRGRGGGIHLSDRWGIDKLNLNHSEVIDLLVALAITEKIKSPLLVQNLKSIRQKITQTFPPHQKDVIRELRARIFIGEPASVDIIQNYQPPKNSVTKVITECFFERRNIEFQYFSAKKEFTTREVEPQILALSWPVWYLAGWDYLRQAPRVFRIDRMAKAKKQNTKMQLRLTNDLYEEFKQYFDKL